MGDYQKATEEENLRLKRELIPETFLRATLCLKHRMVRVPARSEAIAEL